MVRAVSRPAGRVRRCSGTGFGQSPWFPGCCWPSLLFPGECQSWNGSWMNSARGRSGSSWMANSPRGRPHAEETHCQLPGQQAPAPWRMVRGRCRSEAAHTEDTPNDVPDSSAGFCRNTPTSLEHERGNSSGRQAAGSRRETGPRLARPRRCGWDALLEQPPISGRPKISRRFVI